MKMIKVNYILLCTLLAINLSIEAQTRTKTKTLEKKSKIKKEQPSTEFSEDNSMKEMEISREIDIPAGATIKIVAANQNVEIKRSSSAKVKVSTKVLVDKSNTQTNDELMEKYGIEVRSLDNKVNISSKGNNGGYFFAGPNEMKWRYDMPKMNYFKIDKANLARAEKQKRISEEMMKKSERQMELSKEMMDKSQRDQEKMMHDMEKMKSEQEVVINGLRLDKTKIKKLQELSKLNADKLSSKEFLQLNELRSLRELGLLNDSAVIAYEPRSPRLNKTSRIPRMPREPYVVMPEIPNMEKINDMIHIEPFKAMGENFNYNFTFNSGMKSNLIIYVPADVKLDIENKYGNINIADDYKNLSVNISNGSLDARKISNLRLTSKFSSANLTDIDDAEVEFENGNFNAGNIKQLDIDSKFSTIEFDNATNMLIRSQNDNYNIESVDKLQGRKSYGTFRLNKLAKSFDLEGQNADIRIRNFSSDVEKVKLNDKYADVRLPVKDLQNYAVIFDGNYSTVYGPFEKHMKEEKVTNQNKDTQEWLDALDHGGSKIFSPNAANRKSSFNATVGNTSGSYTKFDINCQQCTVDFK
ncbi:MAG: hypothetical protein NVSMB45_03640 [Ginsengibacter sp.]